MFNTLLQSIGNTPLIKLPFKSKGVVCAKLEYLNPGGSLKDRVARHLITVGEQKGLLKPGGTIVDASSGNMGIAMALIGSLKGYRVVISVNEKISSEKLEAIKAYGAQVVISKPTPRIDDPTSYHTVACQLGMQIEGAYMPNQYMNPENAHAHYTSLGPEIWRQTNGKITHFFAGMGTGGTVTGVANYLKEKNPAITIVGVDAQHSFRATNGNPQPYDLEGVGVDFESPFINYNKIDEIITVADAPAFETLNRFSNNYGLLVGPSSGAVAHVVEQYAYKLKSTDLAVAIFGDSGRAYLSKGYYGTQTQSPTTQISHPTQLHNKQYPKGSYESR